MANKPLPNGRQTLAEWPTNPCRIPNKFPLFVVQELFNIYWAWINYIKLLGVSKVWQNSNAIKSTDLARQNTIQPELILPPRTDIPGNPGFEDGKRSFHL